MSNPADDNTPAAASDSAEESAAPASGPLGAATAKVRDAVSSAREEVARRKVMVNRGRRVRLTVARVDPWSTMKLAFLLAFAGGIAFIVLTMALWLVLSGMNFFGAIQDFIDSLQANARDQFQVSDYLGFGRVLSLSVVIAVINVLLMTAAATVSAFLYNICSSLVGGVQVTLTDD